MAVPTYKKAEEVLAGNVQTQTAAAAQAAEAAQKEARQRILQLRPEVKDKSEQARVIAQTIVLDTYNALERGIPKSADSELRRALGATA